MPKTNYKQKWEESEVKILELTARLQELKFKLQAVKALLREEEKSD